MPSDSNVLNNISEPTERRQAERRAARLAVVSQVIHQINATHDPDAIARLAAALLHQRLGFSHTFILWADEVAQELILVATQGVTGLIPTEYRQKVTLGIVGRAARTRQAQLVNDIRLDPDYIELPGMHTLAELCVPIQHEGQLLGVINIESDEPGVFDHTDLEVVQTIADGLAVALQNARLLAEVRRASAELEQKVEARTRDLNTVHETLSDITAQLDLPQVLRAIAERAAHLVSAKSSGILLLDAERNELEIVASHGLERDYTGWRLTLGEGLSGRVVARGQPLVVDDYQHWEGRAAIFAEESFTAVAGVPLAWQGQIIGTLVVLDDIERRSFTQNDIRRLMLLAPQAAIAVRNAQLYQEVRQASEELERKVEARTRDLNAVHETLLDITAQLDLPQVLRAIAERAAHLVSAKASLIDLLDRERNELECATCYGFERDYTGWRLALGEGLAGRVAASGQPLVVDDYQHWEGRAASFAGEPITAVAGVPLTWQGQVIGVLNVMDDIERRSFTQDDVRRLMLLAPQAAIAIVNARLYADAQAKAERLEVLRALDRAIASGGLDIHGLFDTFAEQAARLLGYDRMSLALLEGDQIHLLAVEPGLASPTGPEMWLPRQGTGTYWAIEHNQMLLRPDITQEPHYREDEFLIPAGIRTAVVVPLRAHDQVLGTWNLGRCQPRPYSAAEIEILRTIADQLAVALDHARLHEELVERAARLQHAYAELEEADRLKDQMIQNISHELRLPLTLVKGYLDLALDGAMGEVPAALEETLKTVSSRANDIVAIVERITTLHSLRLNSLELERLSLSELVRQAADLRCQSAKRAGLKLELDLPEDALEVQGNAERLLQVLDNLLDNAVKFTPPGGRIRLRASGGDGMAIVEISDTGIGIPADKLDRIWDRFYQVDGSTTRRYSGVGVGLTLVKDVIEAHGGTVWVHSREGQGSTFGFALRQVT